jgi:hypothetical protein
VRILKIFEEKIFFGTEVTFEAFLSSSQNLKVTRLQGGPQCHEQNFELADETVNLLTTL